MFISLGRFRLGNDGPGGTPCWSAPREVTALIDLVPPGQDADPDVNYAIMLSEVPLAASDCHHSFGTGNVTEMSIDGLGRDAWQSVTGYRPPADITLAQCLAAHLLPGSDPTGVDFARPLTAGLTRNLDIYLGGLVWSHTLTGLTDQFAAPVMRVEVESLAQIYRELGETQYRFAMGALRQKYQIRPVKELIQYLYPSGRDDLPLMDELIPQTVKTETWPTNGAITSGQDNTWTVAAGGFNVASGVVTGTSTQNRAWLGYTFGSNDMRASWVSNYTVNANRGAGLIIRADAGFTNEYIHWGANNGPELYKVVATVATKIASPTAAINLNDAIVVSSIGSTHRFDVNSVNKYNVTDTGVASGARAGINIYTSGMSGQLKQPITFDDLVSGASTYSATSGSTASRASLSAIGVFTKPTCAGTGVLTIAPSSIAATSTFTKPSFFGNSGCTASHANLAGSATFMPPAYTGISHLQNSPSSLNAVATFRHKSESSGDLSSGPAVLAAIAIHIPPVIYRRNITRKVGSRGVNQ